MSMGDSTDWLFTTEEEEHDVTSACIDGLPAWSLSAALQCRYLSALKPHKTPGRHTSFYGEEAEAENTSSD